MTGMNWASENWKRDNAGPLWKMDDDHGLHGIQVLFGNYWFQLGMNLLSIGSDVADAVNWVVTT